jgi:ATP-binding cassette, subfamily B, bacterial
MQIIKKHRLKFYNQLESSDCGAACLAMILSYFGKKTSLTYIKSFFEFTRIGVSVQDIIDVSEKLGLNSYALKLTIEELDEISTPYILYWKQSHFVVLEKITKKKNQIFYYLADPGYGKVVLDKESFVIEWKENNNKGIVLFLEPKENFWTKKNEEIKKKSLFKSSIINYTFKFLKNNKLKYFLSIFLVLIGLLTNWFIPFTFQNIIDLGISSKSLSVVYYLLLVQFVLFVSNFASDLLSQIVLTKLNFILSIELRKKLLLKILRLPITFFDTQINTEILQRLEDQQTIQRFFTWKGVTLVLSILNVTVFGCVLAYFSLTIFGVYLMLSLISILWFSIFFKKRNIIEYASFLKRSENSNNVYEFIMNMPEIKINNAQEKIIEKIVSTQNKLNQLEIKSLLLNNYQLFGVDTLSKLKEIISIAICATFIIEDQMSLGTLLGISYIIGQLSAPLQNLILFLRDTQDTLIANKRLELIYEIPDEDSENKKHIKNYIIQNIYVDNVSFKYPGNHNPFILKDINMVLAKNSVTAIVGSSGSGKTTLLKLLLSYYPVKQGGIYLDDYSINEINAEDWRDKCGTVLQNGNIFSDTIASNISMSMEDCNIDQLREAAKIAGIQDFIEQLPMHYFTRIGNSGIELSGGQKQRILIARAVYKNPNYLFFDEATSALDSENEKIIHDNLQEFFKGRTVVIIAHRLSTVKNADQIIVLKNGQIAEVGNHNQLVKAKSEYYNLVKNQLELGA